MSKITAEIPVLDVNIANPGPLKVAIDNTPLVTVNEVQNLVPPLQNGKKYTIFLTGTGVPLNITVHGFDKSWISCRVDSSNHGPFPNGDVLINPANISLIQLL